MDTPGKRRGIFAGIPGFFRGSSTTPADQDGKKDNSDASAGALVALPPVKPTVPAPAPESPVKRASNTQMASRKILERPQGPSSKLSQSVTAADFTRLSSATPRRTNFSSAVAATPKRMPGDDPNQRPFASSTISHASTSAYRASSNIHNGSATTGRNVFLGRSSVMRRPEIPSFSPRVPANTVKQSFPPNTPGRPPRGSTADISGRGFSQSMSAELFNMRIPSPPRELTGEVLAKQVPNDTGRYGSVYADEFLERYCPPDLDEHQKRQFYCILDLRRLKYAADEVFAKKDWKINIANFAKEYEKSRSLIMLRYGLYEFKTVRPSGSVVKDWKEKHGIPDLEDEAESAVPSLKTNGGGSSKRKAEDELAQNDTALTASSSNGNKRARAPEASPVLPAKNKRKADAVGEPDENQPAKLSRPSATPQKTPSATKSVFESIANNTSTTPAKFLSSKNNFSSSTLGPKLTNGARSVFDGGVKAAPTTNIFSHLSDASKGSSGKDADSEGETSSNPDEDDSEVQEVSPSDEASAAASGGVSTPQFNAPASDKSLNGTQSTASSDGGGPSQGRSLFDRMTKGSDGQPVKLLPSGGKSPLFAAPSDKERSVSPAKEQTAAPPANNTWNASTPIKFGGSAPAAAPGSATSLFTSAAPPVTASTFNFGGATAPKTEVPDAPVQEAPKPSAATNLFGAVTPAQEAPKASGTMNLFGAVAPANEAPKASGTTNLFGAVAPAKEAPKASGTTNLFGAVAPAQETPKPSATTNIFGAPAKEAPKPSGNTSLFGATQKAAESNDAPPKPSSAQPTFSFGSKTTEASGAAPNFTGFGASTTPGASVFNINPFSSATPAFGAPKDTENKESAPTMAAATSSLFGAAKSGVAVPPATPAPSVFQSQSTSFGDSDKPVPAVGNRPIAKPRGMFGKGLQVKRASSPSMFGATPSTPFAASTHALASTTEEPAAKKSAFGNTDNKPTPSVFSSFGANAQAPATETKNTFGGFGQQPTSTPAQSGNSFGFGAASQTPAASQSNTLFGGTSQTPAASQSTLFGSQTPAASQSTTLFGGASQTPAASQTNPTFGGGSASFTFGTDAPVNNPFSSGTASTPGSFSFGSNNDGGSQSANTSFQFGGASATPSINFGAGAASSTPATNMFAFGGGSSQPTGASIFSQQPPSANPIFGGGLAPGGGTSTGTNTPFTLGGASSLATTPATGTPEPAAELEPARGTNADGDEAPQEQISLTDGGPGEEDEVVVHEVRAKALKLVLASDSDDESTKGKEKSPWKVQGVGPLRVLKHKTSGTVRMLLRAEPRGNIALNRAVLPNVLYKVEPKGGKYVKLTTTKESGKGLETWMLQVKTADAAQALADALEANKSGNATEA